MICTNLENVLNDIITKFKSVFSSKLGLCNQTKIKITLKNDVFPIFRQKRTPAISALGKIEDELQRLQHEGVIESIDFADWAAPIVVVRKANGSVRICGDYSTGLNESVGAHNHNLPLPSDLLEKCVGSAYQQLMDSMLAGIEGAAAYLDDIIIFGKDLEEHTQNIIKVLQSLEKYGFTVLH